jgi:hypothetical protein
MSDPTTCLHEGGRRPGRLAAALAGAAALAALAVAAGAGAADLEPRVPAGRVLSEAGTLLAREESGEPWSVAGRGEDVHSRDLLLALPGLRAELAPLPGSVRVTLWGNLPELSDFPGLESAVVLHDSRAFDLDLSLARGRVVLTNARSEGPARVWLRVLDDAGGELTLDGPGSSVAVEVYGRWPRGVPFAREPRPQDRPAEVLSLWALKGSSALRIHGVRHRLSPPPGPALFQWDSVTGPDEGPQRREHLPSWADGAAGASRDWDGILGEVRETIARRGPSDGLRDLLEEGGKAGGDKGKRLQQVAVLGLGATGEVHRVAAALEDPDHPAARTAAVLALRHWIGSAPGHDARLYRLLTDALGYSRKQAEAVMQLLHSPFDPDAAETYEALIAYLRHNRLAVRELAYWHLQRMTPSAEVVPFDAAGPEEERAKSVAAWKKLLADGKLPPKR